MSRPTWDAWNLIIVRARNSQNSRERGVVEGARRDGNGDGSDGLLRCAARRSGDAR